jgi:hypothetical protein
MWSGAVYILIEPHALGMERAESCGLWIRCGLLGAPADKFDGMLD